MLSHCTFSSSFPISLHHGKIVLESVNCLDLIHPSSSPQGRIFQVEYAQEAVKQGSVVVGLVSKTHAVLVALKVSSLLTLRAPSHKREYTTDHSYSNSETLKNSPPTKRK